MLLSKEELDKSSVLLPEIQEHLANIPKPSPDANIVNGIRTALKKMSEDILNRIGLAPEGISESYHDIEMRDGHKNCLKIQKPSKGAPGPLVVLAYGGGFIGGDTDQLSQIGRALVKLFGVTAASISYRHAPEHTGSQQAFDAWDSMKWIADNATGELLNADPAKGFVMGGMSAGACLTVVLSRKFQEDKLAHSLTGQWLAGAPCMDHDTCPEKFKSHYTSHETNAESPVMSKQSFELLQKLTEWDMKSELRNANRSKTLVSGQPKTYFQAEGMDLLRDDMLVYDEMLKEAGVPSKVDFYPGCVHGTLFHMIGTELGNKILVDTLGGFGWLLGKEVSREEAAEAAGVKPN